MNADVSHRIALQLLESARLRDAEIHALLHRALDPDYWRSLSPGPSLEGRFSETESLDAADVTSIGRSFAAGGYFKTEPVFPIELIGWMKECVECLRREKWPLVFAFVYEEFWTIARTESFKRLLTALLGSGYSQTSGVWTYYVIPRRGSAGWPPHIDANGEQRVTVWIPLTDSTLENGCMYVIPRNSVPDSLPADYTKWDHINKKELETILQCSRALPARAGSILGWDHSLIHWGSVSHGSPAPRISIAVEFLGAKATAIKQEHPLVGGSSLPAFATRLYIVAKCILAYRKFEPLMSRYADFAEQLMALCRRQHCAE